MEISEGRVVPLTLLITTPGESGGMMTMLLTGVKTSVRSLSLFFLNPGDL